MKKVTKAVIPAAGLGTRVLPATKAMPKGMLPIVDKPAIQYLVEEAVKSGITDILIILGRNQSIIEDHFDRSPELEEKLAALGQTQDDYLPSEVEKFKEASGYEEFLDIDPAVIREALENPDRSHVEEMLSFAEQAEREYAAQAAAYVQTPADIVAQAQAVQDQAAENSFSIYQLKGGNETLDYRLEPLDSIHRNGLSVKPENYELVYEAPLTEKDNLESIYPRFNVDRPADFTGHSLSVSDIVVLHQNGQDTAHYVDSFGYKDVPEFLQPENYLKAAEQTTEQNYNMIDGQINNTPTATELEEKAKAGGQISLAEYAEALKAEKKQAEPEKKSSIRAQLKAAKEQAPKKQARQKTQDLERS